MHIFEYTAHQILSFVVWFEHLILEIDLRIQPIEREVFVT